MTQFCVCLTDDGERTNARLYIYIAVSLIDLKTKFCKDLSGLEQKEWDFSSLLLVFSFRVNAYVEIIRIALVF